MKYFALENVCIGIVCMMMMGCSNSELTAPESQVAVNDEQVEGQDSIDSIQAPVGDNLTTYLHGVEDKLDQLKVKHAKLEGQMKEGPAGSQSSMALETILGELTKKSEKLHFQMEAMKSAKGEDQMTLQTGMDKTLADLAQSYDNALAEFAG